MKKIEGQNSHNILFLSPDDNHNIRFLLHLAISAVLDLITRIINYRRNYWNLKRTFPRGLISSTGWPIRLFFRFCWHQNKGCVLVCGHKNSTFFWCQQNLKNNLICHPVLSCVYSILPTAAGGHNPEQEEREGFQLRLSDLFRLCCLTGWGDRRQTLQRQRPEPDLERVRELHHMMAVSKLTASTASIFVIFALITSGETASSTVIGNVT